MSLLVHNCPRCGSQKITFDVIAQNTIRAGLSNLELFCICRPCGSSVTFTAQQSRPLYDAHGGEIALSKCSSP